MGGGIKACLSFLLDWLRGDSFTVFRGSLLGFSVTALRSALTLSLRWVGSVPGVRWAAGFAFLSTCRVHGCAFMAAGSWRGRLHIGSALINGSRFFVPGVLLALSGEGSSSGLEGGIVGVVSSLPTLYLASPASGNDRGNAYSAKRAWRDSCRPRISGVTKPVRVVSNEFEFALTVGNVASSI